MKEYFENIINVFDLKYSDLAKLLTVSRQVVYKWLVGSSNPEQNKQNRIIELNRIADKFKEADISRAGFFLKMKAFGEQSLMDLLIAGESTDKYVTALINEAKIMEASYNKSGLSSSKAKPNDNWQSYISIPGFDEHEEY